MRSRQRRQARYGCGTPLAGAVRPTASQSISTTSPVCQRRICIAFCRFVIYLCTNQTPGKNPRRGSSPFLVVLRGIAKGQGLPRESSEAIRVGKGGTTKRTRPAACGGARDMKLARTPPEGRSDYGKCNGNTHNGTNRFFARQRYFRVQRPFLPYLFPQEGKDMVAEGTVTASL